MNPSEAILEIKSIPSDRDVIVRCRHDFIMKESAETLRRHFGPDRKILFVGEGVDLSELDETQMNAAGWFRK